MSKTINILLAKKIGSVASIVALLFCSCSLSKMAMDSFTKSLVESSGTTFTGDDDPELIQGALPFTIKLYESLLEKDSANPDLYLTVSKLICFYAQYFIVVHTDTIQDPIARKNAAVRAKKLFLRARHYSLKSLDIASPGMMTAILKGTIDSVVQKVTLRDIAPLYWTSVAWLGAIGADRSDFSLAFGIKRPVSIVQRVLELDSTYDKGAAHELLGVTLANIPASLGGGSAIAEQHFQQAIMLSKRTRISTFVLYAVSILAKKGDSKEFTTLLNEALSVPIHLNPSIKIQNIIYQQKARLLLSKVTPVGSND